MNSSKSVYVSCKDILSKKLWKGDTTVGNICTLFLFSLLAVLNQHHWCPFLFTFLPVLLLFYFSYPFHIPLLSFVRASDFLSFCRLPCFSPPLPPACSPLPTPLTCSSSNKQLHYLAWEWESQREHQALCVNPSALSTNQTGAPVLICVPWLDVPAVIQTILGSGWLCMHTSIRVTPSPSQSL